MGEEDDLHQKSMSQQRGTGLHGNARKLTYFYNATVKPLVDKLEDHSLAPEARDALQKQIAAAEEFIKSKFARGWKKEVELDKISAESSKKWQEREKERSEHPISKL